MRKYNGVSYVEMTEEEIKALFPKETPKDYKERVIERIRARYSIDDEIAILRQRDTKPEEFLEYNEFVERIKEEEKL